MKRKEIKRLLRDLQVSEERFDREAVMIEFETAADLMWHEMTKRDKIGLAKFVSKAAAIERERLLIAELNAEEAARD